MNIRSLRGTGYLGLIWLALFYITLHCQVVHSHSPADIQLEGKSYLLRASLSIEYPWFSSYRYEIEEIYSAWQRRSRVKYWLVSKLSRKADESNGHPEDAVLYADEQQVVMVEKEHICTQSSYEMADKIFNLQLLKAANFSLAAPIIGPSRLLLFARENSRNQRQVDKSDSIRDKPGMDKFDYTIADKTNSYYSLYYRQDRTTNLPYGLPAQLTALINAVDDYILHYTFKQVQVLPDGPVYSTSEVNLHDESAGAAGACPLFDRLLVPPLIGCARALKPAPASVERLQAADNYRFSFKARVFKEKTKQESEGLEMFVGYEPTISTLRVDRQTPSRLTQLVTNFYTRLTYHTIRRLSGKDLVLDQVLKVSENAKLDNDLSCVVTRAPSTDYTSYPLGEMLFGSGELRWLGWARVRGIETRVYETLTSSWPIWLQQPVLYHTTSDYISISEQTSTRRSLEEESKTKLNIIVYMASSGPLQEQSFDESSRPVLVEIYKVHETSMLVMDKISIPLYDFKWTLSNEGANGASVEQFYSLADACASPTAEDNHYGRVDLLLEHEPSAQADDQSAAWLRERPRRNFALLQAAQQMLNLPASMIYDIDSRLVRRATHGREMDEELLSVSVSMRVAEHTRSRVQLIFIGRGEISREARKKFRFFYASSFQVCYYIAAHQKTSTMFAYNAKLNKCFLYLGQILGNAKLTITTNFNVLNSSLGSLEIYRLRHAGEFKSEATTSSNKTFGDELTILARSHERLSHLDKLRLVDPSQPSARVDVKLRSVEVEELDDKTPFQLDEIQFGDSNKFQGFGLVSGGGGGQLIAARPVNAARLRTSDWMKQSEEETRKFDYLQSDMTFGQCQAECLAEHECRSYSLCVRDGALECLVSSVGFRSVDMVLQLMQLSERKTKLGEQFDLLVLDESGGATAAAAAATGSKVKVKRHPGCELHNKMYLKLFEPARRTSANLRRRFLRPVANREQCAQLTAQRMFETLEFEVMTAHAAHLETLTQAEAHVDTIRSMYDAYKYSHLNLTTAFLYLEMEKFDQLYESQQRHLRAHMVKVADDETYTGYCIVSDIMTPEETKELGENSAGQQADGKSAPTRRMDIQVERHQFDFSWLFEKQHGVSLVESKMEPREQQAYKQIMHRAGKEATRESYELMRLFLEKGENLGYSIITSSEAHCARTCYMQFAPMWPACKSFDVIEITLGLHKETHCFFNSITASDALRTERFDLIRGHPSEQTRLPSEMVVRVVHYEPKTGLALSSLGLVAQLETVEVYARSGTTSWGQLKIGFFGLFCTIFLALMLGLGAGIKLGLTIVWTSSEQQADDVENLVETLPTLEFKNLVNFEGLVAGDSDFVKEDERQEELENTSDQPPIDPSSS